MAIITINTPFNIDLEFKVADFAKRVFAWVIDVIIISVYYYIMVKIGFEAMHFRSDGLTAIVSFVFLVLPVIAYQLVFEIFFNGQTLGKKLVGIKIIDKDGNEPSWGQFITRWLLCLGNLFVYLLPLFIVSNPFAVIGFIFLYLPDVVVMLISPKSQRIGDLAAGTVVIDATYRTDIAETIYQQIEVKDYVPVFPQVMRLTDRDINGIRNLLNIKKPGKDTEIYTKQVVQKIKKVLDIESDIDGQDFLQQLLFDYNYLAGK